MKKVSAFRLSAAATLLALTFGAHASATKEDLAGRVYLGGHIGAMDLDSDRMVSKGSSVYEPSQDFKTFVPGLELGYRISPNWEVRGYYDYLQADLRGTGSSGYGESFGADVLFNITDNFYTGLGINRTNVEQLHDTFARLTVGYRTFLDDNLAFKVEAAAQQDDSNFTDYLANVGIQYFFGSAPQKAAPAPKPAPAPVVVDSDKDGVPDESDACPGTPANYKVDERGCTKYETETVTEKLLVNFDTNSATVKPQYYPELQRVATFMKDFPQLDVVIEGHTDDTGAADYNLKLSERRAASVGEALASQFGIDRARIKTVGYGEGRPTMEGTSKEARAANRRIEAKLSATKRVPETK
ncbi:OmpA family protein [Gallaecimonas xiamenensis]|uniref:OmpA family protein n=1 Tax=Gallaecimonas xiamenensis TaxID=1207039 RepID=UPI0004ACAAFE|nr:OmpA family protein [Gallaecimonas xiamenensis]